MLVVAAVASSTGNGFAQEQDGEDVEAEVQADVDAIPEFDKLRTPNSAAFVLLGVSPTEIQRPTTPRDLGVAVSSFVSDADLVIPTNFSVDVAPYWLFPHDDLTISDIATSNLAQRMIRNLTLSVGTRSTAETEPDAMGMGGSPRSTELAAGFRTRLFDGKTKATCHENIARAAQAVAASDASDSDTVTKAQDDYAKAARKLGEAKTGRRTAQAARDRAKESLQAAQLAYDHATENEKPAKKQAVDNAGSALEIAEDALEAATEQAEKAEQTERKAAKALEDAVEVDKQKNETLAKKIPRLRTLCADAAASRKGLAIDLAGAMGWTFPEATFDDGRISAAAGWITIGYLWSNASLVALGRVRGDKTGSDWDKVLDTGARFVLAYKKYAASAEGVVRFDDDGGDDANVRAAIGLDYMIKKGSWLTVSFGRDFRSDDPGSLFTLANLKWAFGEPSSKKQGTSE